MALAAGLLMGGAMRPQLAFGERPSGPQIFTGAPGHRASGPGEDGSSFASYSGQLPSYVMGTDSERPVVAAAAEPPLEFAEAATDSGYYASTIDDDPPKSRIDAPELTPVGYGAGDEHLAIPSLDGGTAYAGRQSIDLDDEAPPEAAGDTRAAH
jgi:hypothetical protein